MAGIFWCTCAVSEGFSTVPAIHQTLIFTFNHREFPSLIPALHDIPAPLSFKLPVTFAWTYTNVVCSQHVVLVCQGLVNCCYLHFW